MGGIAGLAHFQKNYIAYKSYNTLLVRDMADSLTLQARMVHGEWVGEHTAMGWCGSAFGMSKTVDGYTFFIAADANLSATSALRQELGRFGYPIERGDDSELILYTYIHYGPECVYRLDGIYAFCIWDSMRQQIFACRDRIGAKSFYYAYQNGGLLFGSAPQALFRHPAVEPKLHPAGLHRVLCGGNDDVYANVSTLLPGHTLTYRRSGLRVQPYWTPASIEDSLVQTDEVSQILHRHIASASRKSGALFLTGTPAEGYLRSIAVQEISEPLMELSENISTEKAAEIFRLLAKIPKLTGFADSSIGDAAILDLFYRFPAKQTPVLSDAGAEILLKTAPKEPDLSKLLLPSVRESLIAYEKTTKITADNSGLAGLLRLCGDVQLQLPFCRREVLDVLFRVPVELRMELVQMQCTDSNLCTIQISPEVYIGILQKQIRHLIEDRSAPVLSFLDATALTRLAEIPPAEAIAFERQLTKVLQIDTWFRLYQPRLI